MYSSVTLSKPGRNMSLDDKLVLIISVFDLLHLASRFPADRGAEADSVPTPGVSGSFPAVYSHKWDVLGNGSCPKAEKTPGKMTCAHVV